MSIVERFNQLNKREAKGTNATEDYKASLADAKKKVSTIESILNSHASKQADKPQDWGFVGDMDHINEILKELIDFFS